MSSRAQPHPGAASRLAVFDVDGTLTHTSGIDDACWIQAVEMTFGVSGICTDWGSYRHSTDEAIGAEIVERHLGRPWTLEDRDLLRETFATLVERAAREDRRHFQQVPGAAALLPHLQRSGWRVALATGGWKRTALLKLRTAGVPVEGLPAAFADDAWPRQTLIRLAVARAMGWPEPEPETETEPTAGRGAEPGDGTSQSVRTTDAAAPPVHVVYVGDGTWDVTAARAGGYGFVGVASGQRAEALRRAGAAVVLPDLADAAGVLECLAAATPPGPPMENRTC